MMIVTRQRRNMLLTVVALAQIAQIALALSGWPANLGPTTSPLSTTKPALPGGNVANDMLPGPFYQDFKPPFPTDSWWAAMGSGAQNAVAAGPFPYQSLAAPAGLQFGLQTSRWFDNTSMHMDTLMEFSVSALEVPRNNITSHKALQWDTQTLTIQYFSNTKANNMSAFLVPGSPYMTFQYQSATPFINSTTQLTSINGASVANGTTYSATTFTLSTNSSSYVLYFLTSTNVTLQVLSTTSNATSLAATAPANVVMRFAKVTSDAPRAVLDNYSGTYATAVNMTYAVANDNGTFQYTWQTVGTGPFMMLSWPHHRKTLVNPTYISGLRYMTLKGYMKPVLGNTWTLQYVLPKETFFPLNNIDASCLSELTMNLQYEIAALGTITPGDFYSWGYATAAMSRGALMSEHVGRSDLVATVVNLLKQSWQYWDQTGRSVMGAYETNYGGFINSQGYNNGNVDSGNGYYNNHHHQYGYLLHTAAVIGRYDSQWLANHQYFLLPMARDICNPSPNDPHFTVARHVDFFAGHSWATGVQSGNVARTEGATGESVNAYYGCYLYALTSNNTALQDWSRLLLAQEQLGAQTYWQMHPNETVTDDTVYPEQAMRNLVTVGNVMDQQSGAWIYGYSGKSQTAAYQLLPVTPINSHLYDADWMKAMLNYAKDELATSTIGDQWRSVIFAASAEYNATNAYRLATSLHSWGAGNSASNTLYYIATRSPSTSGGAICGDPLLKEPLGAYYLQDAVSGKYIVSNTASSTLRFATTNIVQAALFNINFLVNARSLQSVVSGLYMTPDPNAYYAASAGASSVGTWEPVTLYPNTDGNYTMTALINNQIFGNTGGGIVNNNGNTPTRFRLVAPPTPAYNNPVPAFGRLVHYGSNTTISVNATGSILRLSNQTEQGAAFNYTIRNGKTYNIFSSASRLYVTADSGGSVALKASVSSPGTSEMYSIVNVGCQYVIIAQNSNNFWAVSSWTGQLFPNGTKVDNSTLFTIDTQNCTAIVTQNQTSSSSSFSSSTTTLLSSSSSSSSVMASTTSSSAMASTTSSSAMATSSASSSMVTSSASSSSSKSSSVSQPTSSASSSSSSAQSSTSTGQLTSSASSSQRIPSTSSAQATSSSSSSSSIAQTTTSSSSSSSSSASTAQTTSSAASAAAATETAAAATTSTTIEVSTTSETATTTHDPTYTSQEASNNGRTTLIAGAAAGGLVLLAAAGVGYYYMRRKRMNASRVKLTSFMPTNGGASGIPTDTTMFVQHGDLATMLSGTIYGLLQQNGGQTQMFNTMMNTAALSSPTQMEF